jgi:predicted nucleic acid-binding protein
VQPIAVFADIDVTYVALAEHLECVLLTADGRMSRSPGIRCTVEVIGT